MGAVSVTGADRLRLDPRTVVAGRLFGWIFTSIVALVLGGGCLVALIGSHAPLVSWAATTAILAAILVPLALAAQIGPAWRFENTWLRLDADGLEFARGRWWRHHVSIPRARIQHTDVTQGPVERQFGLGTLVIYTAGTHHAAVPIEGLPYAAALALRDALLSRPGVTPAAEPGPAPVDGPPRPPRMGDDDAV
jgi:membrane protein YdbS with pleckstrin-like domain